MGYFSGKKTKKPSAKKGSAAIERKVSERGTGRRESGGILALWIEVVVFLIFSLLLYCLASLFSVNTGSWGAQIRFSLLRNWGGATVIPILFGCYLCISYFLKTGAAGMLSQAVGTFLLFLCTAFLFGLFQTVGMFSEVQLFTPGYLGQGLAVFFNRQLGHIGATLLAGALLLLSATFYGVFNPASVVYRVSRVVLFIRGLLTSFRLRKKKEYEDEEEPDFSPRPVEQKEPEDEMDFPSRFVMVRPPAHGIPEEVLKEIRESGEYDIDSSDPPAEEPVRDTESEPLAETVPSQEEAPEVPIQSADDFPEESAVAADQQEDLFILRSPSDFQDEGASKAPDEDREAELAVDFPDGAMPEIDFSEIDEEENARGGTFPPPLELFGPRQDIETAEDNLTVREQAASIVATLADFGVNSEMADVVIGPTVIQFQLQLAPGVKVSKVSGLSNDLAVALTVPSLRVEAPIPGKPYVGVEIPNPKRKGIILRTILESRAFQESENDLPLAMGMRVDSSPLVVGLEDLPHLLVAGTTGSGKSVFVTSCITGLCSHRTPDELRLILIDPKRVELSVYERLPHVLAKPVVSPKKAVQALAWAVREMERRYEVFARARVRNLKSYNLKVLPKAKLPNIVIVVDELADLMFTAQKDVEDYICRLAQMARATGIHLLLATQRPSVNVITGLIKANIPARVAFTLPSQTDSRTIIDVSGAERLLGKGDMLFVSSKYPRPLRLQAPFLDDARSMEIVEYLENYFGPPEYVDIEAQGPEESGSASSEGSFADDPLLEEAVEIVMDTGIASASRLQRQLRGGFTRAARLVDTMERIGIVGPPDGSKPRDILVDDETAKSLLARVMSGEVD